MYLSHPYLSTQPKEREENGIFGIGVYHKATLCITL